MSSRTEWLLFLVLGFLWGSSYVFVGIALGALVLQQAMDARLLIGTAPIIGGIGVVNSRFGATPLFSRSTPTGSSSAVSPPR